MLLRSIGAVVAVCSVFVLWAIAVSADDAKQGGLRASPLSVEAESGY
jgi:hypothetical protein